MVFNGCLVGANPVTAEHAGRRHRRQIGTTPSLATYVQQRATALGLPPGFSTLAARASVSAPSSFRNGAGDLTFTYPRDPDAFGPAAGYVATGIEPEGLFTAAVEVAALSSAGDGRDAAANRLARPADPGDWWDTCTRALVTVALRPIGVGAGISAERLNGFAHLAGTPFLSHFGGDFGVGAGTWVSEVNPHPDAADIYTTIVATSFMAAPTDQKAIIGRFTLEQGWLAMGGARIAPMITFLDGTPATFTARSIQAHLDTVELAGQSAALFPVGGPTSPGAAPARAGLAVRRSGERRRAGVPQCPGEHSGERAGAERGADRRAGRDRGHRSSRQARPARRCRAAGGPRSRSPARGQRRD